MPVLCDYCGRDLHVSRGSSAVRSRSGAMRWRGWRVRRQRCECAEAEEHMKTTTSRVVFIDDPFVGFAGRAMAGRPRRTFRGEGDAFVNGRAGVQFAFPVLSPPAVAVLR